VRQRRKLSSVFIVARVRSTHRVMGHDAIGILPISKAFAKEQALMTERKKKVLALFPLDLDGYLFRME
jgi:hypothetical protein